MKIAIVGYGRMGKMVHSILSSSEEHSVTAIIDPESTDSDVTARKVCEETLSTPDAVIEFSSPSAVLNNLEVYAHLQLPAVIGTTGWLDNLQEAENIAKGRNPVIYSGNFSLGVAVFLHLVSEAGKLINRIPSYDVSVTEVHHREKADAPSGTALMAGERLLRTIDRKTGFQSGNPVGKTGKDKINISSSRTGYIPGIHTITIDGSADTIEIKYTARTREGFAEGAIKAAEWLIGKEPGLYTMDDFITNLIGGNRNA